MPRPADEQTEAIIQKNWLDVSNQIAEACQVAGRNPAEVQVVGVAKYVDAALTAQLVQAGCKVIGENRPQLLWEKSEWFEQHQVTQPAWHLIGHLQRNKIRRSLPLVQMIQSVDSWRLAQEISQEAVRVGRIIDVLIDVNLTQDDSKTGILQGELLTHCDQIASLPNLRWRGLMAMSSLGANSPQASLEFAQVRELRDTLSERLKGSGVELSVLSMGMSGDFREAIAEGSTCVRIGSNLWTDVL